MAHFWAVNRRLIDWFICSIKLRYISDRFACTTISFTRVDNRDWGNVWSRRHHSRPFFIWISDKRKDTRLRLHNHYLKIKDSVIDYWLKLHPLLHEKIGQGPKSFIPLYTDIGEKLQEPIYFESLRTHFENESYNELRVLLDDILNSEPNHNQRVADFTIRLSNRIRMTIHSRTMDSSGCQIPLINEYDPNTLTLPPHYLLDSIVEYLYGKASDNSLNIDIRLVDEKNRIFQVYRVYDMKEIGRGDETTMNCLLQKIRTMETELVKQIESFITEANRINKLFNRLKAGVRGLIVQIDGRGLFGRCDAESNL